jgi:Tfp pilus assembly protein PilE
MRAIGLSRPSPRRAMLARLLREESGITLVELITALGIAAFVLAFVGTAAYQFYRVTGWGNERMLLASNLQTAQLWLGRDAVQANAFSPESAPSYGTFTIPTSTSDRLIRYAYDSGQEALTRTDLSSGDTVVVARDIAGSADVAFSLAGRDLAVQVTATRGSQADTLDLHFTLRVP